MILRYRLTFIATFLLCALPIALLTSCKGGGIIPGRDRKPEINEEEARAHLKTALEFMEAGQWAHANFEFKAAIDADYRLSPAHIGYQDSFFRFFNPEVPRQVDQQSEMLKMYEMYARERPSEAMFQYLCGRMLDKMNRRKEAVPYFKKAIKLNDRYYLAHADLARFYSEVDKSPALAKYHKEKSEKYRAIHELRTRLAAKPFDIALHRQYQDAMLAAERSNDLPSGTVIEEYRKRLQDVTGDRKREAQYLYLYGRLLGQAGELEEARKHFERASLLDEKLPWPYDGLGTYYIRKAQEIGAGAAERIDCINKALQALEKAARKGPDQTVIQLKLAGLYVEVSSLRLKQADTIRANAAAGMLTRDDERRIKGFLREAYRMSSDSKAILLGLVNEGVTEPGVYRQLASLMFGDGCYFTALQTALAGLALMEDNPPPDPAAREKLHTKLTGIVNDCKVYIARLEENRDTSGMPFPQLFFKKEFRARMRSEVSGFRARTVKSLAAFYVQVLKDREKIDPAILPDYEQMQKDALVQLDMALSDGADEVRREAIKVLGLLRVAPSCEKIGAMLIDPDENAEVRRDAATTLGEMRTVKAVDYLIRGLKSGDRYVRENCASALVKLGVQTFGYNFDDKPAQRAEKIKKIEDWWRGNRETYTIPRDN
ncbi:MAG: hypothetical protein DRP79_02270 [Planctomycetota bacterium]|nr:MAG: hypothetical protein DRP79_02270 [Planctomycetota bacterium]